ncbi:CDP-glycerol glycerophosphotransferase family protein [Paenibacillus sp. FSL M7-0802]|uniref:CDP-glycerol glycerophosphotransferase family protein n=1 Tax=Paenibacillus TaxID=44249 RepID=UPI0003D2F85E|nr:CDP-glycerol glycerophosphotransferase family protein [Paenibacillus polymyxa]AIW41949.1 hypothetical protein X809_39535 [Paenibacillus polymyxa CR1]
MDKIKITMFHLSSSGSNNYYLYHAATKELLAKYEIELLTDRQALYNRYIDHSDVYITTHGEYSSNYDKINIDMWHGFPLKGMAKMDKQEEISDTHIHEHWAKMDMIMSYSSLYNTAMNACNGGNISQYRITGLPRNDALFSPHSKKNLENLFPKINMDTGSVIFFMPTFRKSFVTPDKLEGGKNFSNIFGFSEMHQQNFIEFLEENDITLVVKLHPFEEKYFTEELNALSSEHIIILNDNLLSQNGMDLYDILGSADILITDYSSVYIDYLLLERPILFLPTDLEEYKGNRGFLFEPYDFWTPGPKATTQHELQDTISRFLVEPDWYKQERSTILTLCHKYQDHHSASRIWELVDQYIEEHREVIQQNREIFYKHKQLQSQIKAKINEMIELGEIAQANQAIQQYLEDNAADSEIYAMNGMLHLLNNNPQEAIETFEIGHRAFPWDEDLIYNMGYVYEWIGDKTSALIHYQKALDQSTQPKLTSLLLEKLSTLSSGS